MARCRVRLVGPSACESKAVHEVHLRSAARKQRSESVFPSIESESARPYNSNSTFRSDTLCTVIDRPFLITELFRSGTERYARKIVKLPHCINFEIETNRSNLKIDTMYTELVREVSYETFETEVILREKVRIGDKTSVFGRVLYREKVVTVLKRQIVMCPSEESKRSRAAENERLLYPMDTSLF